MPIAGMFFYCFHCIVSYTDEIDCPTDQLNIPLAWILISATLITALKELYQFCTAPNCGFYFIHLENIGQILVITAAAVAAIPVLKFSLLSLIAGARNSTDDSHNETTSSNLSLSSWNYQMAAVSKLHFYIELLLLPLM